MTAMQRRKGKVGELELVRLLRELLGANVARNLEQSRQGGADLLGLPGWAIEVKRAARARLSEWWLQTCTQAEVTGQRPALFYRLDRQPWRVVVALRPDRDAPVVDQTVYWQPVGPCRPTLGRRFSSTSV